ncbi:DNA mismatch repair protein MutT [Paenibacillus montanisoli]|uniref:DNA mismatch repair protein MutT n=2 Tax=Paenibacillus montanisoli TaxID=2081970 RepID=A0A328TYP1_9BACL|nr:NUDIX hydrolase [Paenibacillus montanisoli]RAP75638.1 DNA mismatch repair protein MutT [Paenibacillus montanisoli]
MWKGAAAVCINEENKLLMVLQGKPEEEKRWSVPSGGMEEGESLEQCCFRESWEETGYKVAVGKQIHVKSGESYGIKYTVHYFACDVIGGEPAFQDPDGLIHDIAWKSADELRALPLSFPEDLPFLLNVLSASQSSEQM